MFGIKPKTLHFWYQDALSGYKQAKEAKNWGDKSIDIVDKETGEVLQTKAVEIVKPENFSEQMTIDEKQIGKKMYTIMTNSKTGKIGLLVQTMKVQDLSLVVEKYLKDVNANVKSISCDMSPSYKKFCRINFKNTDLVIDKFHVIKYLMDALQQVRKEIKSDCILKNLDGEWHENLQLTTMELIEKSRYIIVKHEADWDENERKIIEHLFAKYPNYQSAYELTIYLRNWYNKKNVNNPFYKIEKELYHWFDLVIESNLKAFRAVRRMIEKHYDDIINYFKCGQTNAKAENMNSKIQRFFANNYGIKNRDFFLYRIAGYFGSHIFCGD